MSSQQQPSQPDAASAAAAKILARSVNVAPAAPTIEPAAARPVPPASVAPSPDEDAAVRTINRTRSFEISKGEGRVSITARVLKTLHADVKLECFAATLAGEKVTIEDAVAEALDAWLKNRKRRKAA